VSDQELYAVRQHVASYIMITDIHWLSQKIVAIRGFHGKCVRLCLL